LNLKLQSKNNMNLLQHWYLSQNIKITISDVRIDNLKGVWFILVLFFVERRLVDLKGVSAVYKLSLALITERCKTIFVYLE
jgi:hypothetical protein